MKNIDRFIEERLEERKQAGNYRTLKTESGLIDFCSNDYLGFARSPVLKNNIESELKDTGLIRNGATGSRLLSGNSSYTEAAEQELADLFNSESALLFNSGYDANLGLFSSIARRGDTFITDELIHASIIDGIRLSNAARYTFKHNDLESLEDKLKHAQGNRFVAIESVYSMDGDSPPIAEIISLCNSYDAALIVDEAHAVGLYGFGLTHHYDQDQVFARIVTFGKALGCHGAMVLASRQLRNYLINFARPFIYSTAPALHHVVSVKMACRLLHQAQPEIKSLAENIGTLKNLLKTNTTIHLIESDSAIQCIMLKNNEEAKQVANYLQHNGLDVRPILSPTVAAGKERIRICLHVFNTEKEIILLADSINQIIND